MDNHLRFWAPLINFHSGCSVIDLSRNCRIRKLSNYDEEVIDTLSQDWPTVEATEFLLEVETTQDRPEENPRELIETVGREYIETPITILRLYKEEIVGYNLIIQPLSAEKRYGSTALALKHLSLWGSSQVFAVSDSEIDDFSKFFAEFYGCPFRQFDLAVHYFNKSYNEAYIPRDSLLDLMISLENLYLKGEYLELGYKLRIRMAFVLGDKLDGSRKREIFDDVKKAYSYRGDIVHGEKDPKIPEDFFLRIREYTRKSLIVFLRRPDLRKDLDDIVLGNACIE